MLRDVEFEFRRVAFVLQGVAVRNSLDRGDSVPEICPFRVRVRPRPEVIGQGAELGGVRVRPGFRHPAVEILQGRGGSRDGLVADVQEKAVEVVEQARADGLVPHLDADVQLVAADKELRDGIGRVGGHLQAVLHPPAAAREAGVSAELHDDRFRGCPGGLVHQAVEGESPRWRGARPQSILALQLRLRGHRGEQDRRAQQK